MRPDEQANAAQVQREKEFRSTLGRVGTAAATTAFAMSPLVSRIMPFLSEHVPYHLAYQGLQRVSPPLANFLKRGQEQGLNVQDGLNYIKDNLIGGNQPQQEKQQVNIVEQASPDLNAFMIEEIKKGRDPLQAGAIAQNNKNFASIIGDLTRNHKAPWSKLIEMVYGQGNPPQGQQPQPQAQAEQRQVGPGETALMQLLDKIDKTLGNK